MFKLDYTLNPISEVEAIEITNNMRNGQFHTLGLRKVFESKKHPEAEIIKLSLISGRFGVDFDHLQETIAERENGKEKGELKGFECLIEDFLYRSLKDGRLYIRFTSYKNAKHSSQFFLNGHPVDASVIAGEFLAPSKVFNKPSDRDSVPMFIAADSIVYLQ